MGEVGGSMLTEKSRNHSPACHGESGVRDPLESLVTS